jgi:hypothetical protein
LFLLFCAAAAAGIARNFTAIGTKMAAAGADNASFCDAICFNEKL